MSRLIVLTCLWLIASAHAASFNCSMAKSKVEHIICDTPSISRLDEELAQRFVEVLQNRERAALVIQAQRQWLKDRNLCADAQCITQAYTSRIADLSSNRIQTNKSSIALPLENAKACREVADRLNRSSLNELTIESSNNPPPDEDIKRIFGDLAELGQYWLLDLNNDGVKDQLLIFTNGSMGFLSIFARSGIEGAIPYSMGTDISSEMIDRADVIVADGRNYIFDGDKLWNLSKEGKLQAVCEFEYVGNPIVEILSGKEKPICNEILASNKDVQHIRYDAKYRLSDPKLDNYSLENNLNNDVVGTHVDIDNDGKLDSIVRLEYMSGRGRGCVAMILAITDNSATHIPDTKLNDLLLNDLASDPCGSNFDVLVHGSETYVDKIHDVVSWGDPLDKGGHTLYRIEQGKAEVICESKTRIKVHAVGIK